MEFGTNQRREPQEGIVPMINIVFLLLVFFLMTAQVAPPEPFEVEPPESAAGVPGAASAILHVSSVGEAAFGDLRGSAALEAIAAEARGGPVAVRAHAELPAAVLARLLAQLGARDVGAVDLATVSP